MKTISTIALEGYTPEQIAAVKDSFAARANQSWSTPAEFVQIYPEALKNDSRELLRKAANAANLPQSRQVARMTTLIDNLRWKNGDVLAWNIVKELFPDQPKQQMTFYALSLAQFGRKRTFAELEQLLLDWDPEDSFILDTYEAVRANPAALDEIIFDKIQAKDSILANEGKYSPRRVAAAVDEVEYELQMLSVVEDILAKKDDVALLNLAQVLGTLFTPKDVADMFVDLVSLFRLSTHLDFAEAKSITSKIEPDVSSA